MKTLVYKNRGFTLIEIIVVLGLLGIVSAITLSSYTATLRNSRNARRLTDIEKLRTALEEYRADNAEYPAAPAGSTETGLKSFLAGTNLYFSTSGFPKDPQDSVNTYYYYQRDPDGTSTNTYRLCAYLETPTASSDPCPSPVPNAATNCRSGATPVACNYGVTQP